MRRALGIAWRVDVDQAVHGQVHPVLRLGPPYRHQQGRQKERSRGLLALGVARTAQFKEVEGCRQCRSEQVGMGRAEVPTRSKT